MSGYTVPTLHQALGTRRGLFYCRLAGTRKERHAGRLLGEQR
nr:MAG TPA: hypothetical protein [Caudoviricetes sp.]